MTEHKIEGTKYELALAFAELDAIKILLSIVVTFMFWFLLAVISFAIYLSQPKILNHLLSLQKVLLLRSFCLRVDRFKLANNLKIIVAFLFSALHSKFCKKNIRNFFLNL